MNEQEESGKNESEKPSPISSTSPVKSRAAQVQETVDSNLAERAARQKVTDDVEKKRREQAAAKAVSAEADLMAASEAAAAEAEVRTSEVANAEAVAAFEASAEVPAPEGVRATVAQIADEQIAADKHEADAATEKILAEVLEKSASRELREIEMHNCQMDAIQNLTSSTHEVSNNLAKIVVELGQIKGNIHRLT